MLDFLCPAIMLPVVKRKTETQQKEKVYGRPNRVFTGSNGAPEVRSL